MPCVFSKPLEFIEDEKYIFYIDGTIFHKRLRRFCRLYKSKKGYLRLAINNEMKMVHRLIWEKFYGKIPEGLQVDHINHVKHDNRLINLQLLTNQENCSRRLITKANKTGYKCVSFNKALGKYQTYVCFQGKIKHLGYFNTTEEASQAYNNELNSNEKYKYYPRN